MLTLTSPHQTPLHRWPAGLKLALLATATLALFLAPLAAVALALALLAATAFALGLGPAWARLLWLLWPLAVVLLLWHGLTGTPWTGALAVARMGAAVGAANLVTMTTRLADMQAVFLRLARPLSPLLPPARLALAFALVIRFIPVMLLRWQALTLAFRARSARRPGWRSAAPAALAALDDADHVAEALRARGGVG
jgi:biotin transport system permease protein